MFFVFDGIDGAGKSTQIELFVQWLRDRSPESGETPEIITCRDPGSTELGNQLREILLGRHETPIHICSEMLMFTTARTQLVEQIIRPALVAGKNVVLDRYILSTVVYQGHAGLLDPEDVWAVNKIATGGLMPDMTFVMDLDVETAMKRLGNSLDRMESRGSEYMQAVRDGFFHEAQLARTGTTHVIDAGLPVDEIQHEIRQLASNTNGVGSDRAVETDK